MQMAETARVSDMTSQGVDSALGNNRQTGQYIRQQACSYEDEMKRGKQNAFCEVRSKLF
jgi:hypothetical protein